MVTGITSTASAINGKVGDVIKVTPNVTPVDAANKQVAVTLEASGIVNSDKTETASGSEISFTAVAAGTTNAVFTAKDGSGIQLTIPVNITAA